MDQRPHRKLRDAGGTPGGLGNFLVGLGMAIAGFYLLTNRIYVQSGWGRLWGNGKGGLLLLGVLFGFGLVFANGRSIPGWLLVVGGLGLCIVEVIASTNVVLQPMPLWEMLVIFVLFGGGLGMIVRAVRGAGRGQGANDGDA
jgi:hypothetical protein